VVREKKQKKLCHDGENNTVVASTDSNYLIINQSAVDVYSYTFFLSILHNCSFNSTSLKYDVFSSAFRNISLPVVVDKRPSRLWGQTGTDGELLLPIVLTRTGGCKC